MAVTEVLVMATWVARTRDEPTVVCTTVHWPVSGSISSNLPIFRLPRKGKNCAGKAKLGVRFSNGIVNILTSLEKHISGLGLLT